MVTAVMEVAIVGWFASSTISKLLDRALSYYTGQKSWQSGMKDQLDRLAQSRPQIETLVYAAERGILHGAHHPPLEEWLGQLRDAVEEADNVLDELEYQNLKEENVIMKFAVRAAEQDDVLKRLRDVVKTFDDLVTGLGTFAQILSGIDGRFATDVRGDMGREFGSLFTETEFFGREKEKQTVISWLKSSDTEMISVFSIVGVAGVGKTALAQYLFDHKQLEYFKVKMWVCVSNTFEEKAIIKKILESLTKTKHEFDTLNAAQRTLMDMLSGQKFLLVLDDVWNDNEREKWAKLMAPLRHGGRGSKILVTTRMESVGDIVAKVVGEPKRFLNLNGLEERENMLLFKKYAFVGFDPSDYERLQSIGKQIAMKLRGIPLVVKTIGGILNNKLEDEYWTRVLKDGALDSGNCSHGIMAAIRLSYEHLSPELKPCFRYCSLFPQDHEFSKEQLVDMWISVGLIPENEERQEEVASDFFETLVKKSFFEQKASHYIMHDLLHELAQIVSKNECLCVFSNNPILIPQNIRHLSLRTSDILVLKNLPKLKYLRTLLLSCDIEDVGLEGAIGTALKGFKTVRYLELSSKQLCEFRESIGSLVHLRCLSITRTKISKLSQCVCMLYHLQILEVILNSYFDHSKWSIPYNICMLSKLKRLRLPSNVISMVPNIGKLTSLQQLIGYGVTSKAGYDLSELEMMSELRELTITNLENVKSIEEASKAKLNSKQKLLCITLVWGRGFDDIEGSNELDKEVADCLQPHAKITDLLLNGYRSTTAPKWLETPILPNLTAIKLAHCSTLGRLPPLGQLPYLKFLNLQNLDALKKIGVEFYGSNRFGNTFPALKMLELKDLTKLEEWEDAHEKSFPRLKRLVVAGSPSLKKLPPIPNTLKELELRFLKIATLPEIKQQDEENSTNQGLRFLSSLLINGCSKLASLSSGFFSHHAQLASLEELEIIYCDELTWLPSEGFRDLMSLKSLRIEGCIKLFLLPMFLPKNFFPPSIQRVMLSSCGDLIASLPQLLPNLSLISFLKLEDCSNLISLPSKNVLRCLSSLEELWLLYCKELKSLGGLEAIQSLKILVIRKCPVLSTGSQQDPIKESSQNRSSMVLDKLDIDCADYLLVVPLTNLQTKSAEIRGFHSITTLPEQWLLQNGASLQNMDLYDLALVESLPNSLQMLVNLRVLVLCNAFVLTMLPDLPRSLEVLIIAGCCEDLAGRLQDGGPDYDKVSHLELIVYGVHNPLINELFN